MKSFHSLAIKLLTVIFALILVNVADAGRRYRDIVFSSATITTGIQFGRALDINGATDSLYLDLYEPTGDTLTLRPLVICIHGGSLVSGVRSDMSLNCTDFAERGYVSATIDYRLGIGSPKGVTTILEALLRGVQDTKAAVRFFRLNAAQYGIDTSQIYLEGSSAGSMVAVHYGYWNEDEIPTDVNQAKWGDIEGTSGNPGLSSSIKGIINYCGGIVDPTWINAGEVPVASIDGVPDTIVPQDSGVSGDFGIELYGGITISRIATQLGIYNQAVFFPGQGHGGGADSLQGFASNFFYTLMVLSSSSPTDLTSMHLSDHSLNLFRYDTHSFFTTAVDKNGNTIILPHSMVQYSCDSSLGSIEPYGVFTPSAHPDSGYVLAKFNGTTDSCFVRTYDFKYFALSPKLAVTDSLTTLQISVNIFDADSVQHYLPITMFRLTSTVPSVGTIDSTGLFTGLKTGITKIIASFNGTSDTGVVRVECATGLVSFDPLESVSGWTFDGSNLDSLSVTLATDQMSVGSASFRINYKYTYAASTTYMVYLNKDIPVYGIPDSIFLDVKSDGRNHRLYYRFADVDSDLFRAIGRKYLNDSTSFANINAGMTAMSELSGTALPTYPLTFERIEIQLAGSTVIGQSSSGTIYVDNLRLEYPGGVSGIENKPISPTVFRLEQNFPNPFNPSTFINYQLSTSGLVTLRVYDILGRLVRTLLYERQNPGNHSVIFNAGNLPSGVYFYTLRVGNHQDSKKFLLLK